VALDIINLSRFLPDPDAKSGDCQRWEFVGDRGPVPYNLIKGRFSQPRKPGPYNVGYREFMDQWPECGQQLGHAELDILKDDPSVADIGTSSPVTYLQAWEYHGRIYFSDRGHSTECVLTVVTDLNATDPNGGVVVRFQEVPAVKMGCRPYVVYHLVPQAGPLGLGLIEPNLDLIWLLSHSVNLFIDACRLLAIPMIKAMKGSDVARETSSKTLGDLVYPGKIFVCSSIEDVQPFSLQIADLRALIELIQYLEKMLEKRTSVSDSNRGISENRKTASEVVSLQQASQQPLEVALALFKQTFLDPFGRIALAQFQRHITDDQTVWMRGAQSNPVPQTLTAEEIQTGAYAVEATVDMPRHAKISRAQTILQVIPVLQQNALPLLMVENTYPKMAGLFQALLQCLDIPDETNVMEQVDEQTKMQLLQMLMPQQAPAPNAPQQPQGGETGQPIQPDPGMGEGNLPPEIMEMIRQAQYSGQATAPVPTGQQMAA
jgi:hypothetical protein